MKYIKETDEGLHELWFCCQKDSEDDWGTGSFDLAEAVAICKDKGYTLIGVIDDNERDPFCLDELEPSEYYDWTPEQIHNEQS